MNKMTEERFKVFGCKIPPYRLASIIEHESESFEKTPYVERSNIEYHVRLPQGMCHVRITDSRRGFFSIKLATEVYIDSYDSNGEEVINEMTNIIISGIERIGSRRASA